jgi:hypothetical protein
MFDPPLELGNVKATLTSAFPGVGTRPVGAFGTVAGVTGLDDAEGADVPAAFVAVTANV